MSPALIMIIVVLLMGLFLLALIRTLDGTTCPSNWDFAVLTLTSTTLAILAGVPK